MNPDERRRLTKHYETVVEEITTILIRADPIGIGSGIGNPHEDEYELEAAAIVGAIPEAGDVNDLERLVHDVFVKNFGAQTAGPQRNYAAIAREIWAASSPFRSK